MVAVVVIFQMAPIQDSQQHDSWLKTATKDLFHQNGILIFFSDSEFSDVWFNHTSLKSFLTWLGKNLKFSGQKIVKNP